MSYSQCLVYVRPVSFLKKKKKSKVLKGIHYHWQFSNPIPSTNLLLIYVFLSTEVAQINFYFESI